MWEVQNRVGQPEIAPQHSMLQKPHRNTLKIHFITFISYEAEKGLSIILSFILELFSPQIS